MNLPLTPPTDSLYKFMSIAGLVLIVVGVIFPMKAEEEERRLSIVSLDALESVKIDHDRDTHKARSTTQAMERFASTQPEDTPLPKELLQVFKDLEPKMAETMRRLQEIITANRHLDAMRERVAYVRWLARIMVTSGALLTVAGFVAWYFKIQRLQDALLAIELETATCSLKELKGATRLANAQSSVGVQGEPSTRPNAIPDQHQPPKTI